MVENQTQGQKVYILSFPYRRTGMGGFDDTTLLSFRSKRPIKSVLRTSRTGNHGNRSYRLFPGKYLAYEVSRSNAGNLYCTISIVKLSENRKLETEKTWEVYNMKKPLLTLDDLPQEIREILEANKEELPLFRQVFSFDQQDNQEVM